MLKYKFYQSKKGFTLIEMMMVVVIIGILAAIAVPNFLKYQAKARRSEVTANLSALYVAQISYFSEHNAFSTVFSNLDWVYKGPTRYEYFLSSSETTGDVSGLTMPTGVEVGPNGFTAGATGNIDSDVTFYDMWTINEKKALINTSDDIAND